MKATEIMVGDRLAYRGQYAAFDFRVEQVTKHKVGYHAEPGENRMHYLRLHEVQPIPITPEILERNGFKQGTIHKDAFVFEDDNEHMVLVYLKDTNYTHGSYTYIDAHCGCLDISEMPVDYIHELQHVLRLCGIDKEITL